MIEYWRKHNIDEYISNVSEYYRDCSREQFRTQNLVDLLNLEERRYLNEHLCLDKLVGVEKQFILHNLLKDPSKFNFAKYLLISLNIELEVSAVDKTGTSIFQLLLDNFGLAQQYSYFNCLLFLYKRGFKNYPADEIFLVDYYKNRIKSPEYMEIWSMARICYKLNDPEKIEKAFRKDRVLLSILSFKQGRPIGFKYPNLLALANNSLQHYGEHGDILLRAMRHYKVYDDIKKRDKKGAFTRKEEDYNAIKPIQDVEFNEIVYEIFPELRKTD